jgi:hypothetical protein
MKTPVLLLGILLLAIILVLASYHAHQQRTSRASTDSRRLESLPLRVLRTSRAPKTVRVVKHKQS